MPLASDVVVHGTETGPPADVVWLPMVVLPRRSVNALAVPLVPSTHITTQAVPPTLAPAVGWVMTTLSGVAVALDTVTVRLDVAVRPAESVTLTASAWLPLATEVVFQVYEAVVATCTPSMVSR